MWTAAQTFTGIKFKSQNSSSNMGQTKIITSAQEKH